MFKKTLLFFWLIFPVPTYAGEYVEQSWENLKQLRVGQRVEVMLTSLKSMQGTWVDFSDDMISLKVDDQVATVQRPKRRAGKLARKPQAFEKYATGFGPRGRCGIGCKRCIRFKE